MQQHEAYGRLVEAQPQQGIVELAEGAQRPQLAATGLLVQLGRGARRAVRARAGPRQVGQPMRAVEPQLDEAVAQLQQEFARDFLREAAPQGRAHVLLGLHGEILPAL